jgi:hypothetical protein
MPPVSVTSQALKLVAERAVRVARDAGLEVVAPVLEPTATRATEARAVTAKTARIPLRRLLVRIIRIATPFDERRAARHDDCNDRLSEFALTVAVS